MSETELELFKDAIEKGILKGIELVGIENIDWFNIRLQKD